MRVIAGCRLGALAGAASLVLLAGAAAVEAPAAAPAPATVPAPAADAEAATREPCRAVVEQHCKDIQPGPGRLLACLEAHRDAASPECRARIDGARRARQRVAATPVLDPQTMLACSVDRDTVCKGVRSGGGRLRACLTARKPELSARCRAALERQAGAPKASPPAGSTQ